MADHGLQRPGTRMGPATTRFNILLTSPALSYQRSRDRYRNNCCESVVVRAGVMGASEPSAAGQGVA